MPESGDEQLLGRMGTIEEVGSCFCSSRQKRRSLPESITLFPEGQNLATEGRQDLRFDKLQFVVRFGITSG